MKTFAISIHGGSAKAMGAIGLIRFLREEGLKPSIVAGSSAGAIIAAMVAMDISTDEMINKLVTFSARKLFSLRSILEYGSMISYETLKKELSQYGEHHHVEDFISPRLIIFASDENSKHRHFIDRGHLINSVLASCAYPIFFPSPIYFNGKKLLDGDLTSSFSTKYLKSQGIEKVIGVGYKPTHKPHYRKIFPIIERAMTYFRFLAGEIDVQNESTDHPDLRISYDADIVGYFNFAKCGLLADIAYEEAKRNKEKIFHLLETTTN